MLFLLLIIYRTVIIYFVVLIMIRLMGKREIGQLSPFDFVVAIIFAELATIPMESPDIPLWHGLAPLVTLVILEMALSYVSLYSHGLRRFMGGVPQIVIQNGRILKKEMRKARYNLDDLLGQLREKGVFAIEDVEFAILEPTGRLSIILRSRKRPVTPDDLGMPAGYEGYPTVLVMDGVIIKKNLQQAGLSESWLADRLAERGGTLKSVFLATIGANGRLYIDLKD